MTKAERTKISHGTRKRFKGKMGRIGKFGGKFICIPRSHTHGGGNPAFAGWTQGDYIRFKHGKQSRSPELGPFRRQMPKGRQRFGGAFEVAA